MTIILRLQGLDAKAGTEDIRNFFKCLFIPKGGVYIVGGSLREAFIAFTTERDGQLAMQHTGDLLKGSVVTLHLSSMAELELKLKLQMKRRKEEDKLQMKRNKMHPKKMDVKLRVTRKEELQMKNKKKPSPTQQGVNRPQGSTDANQPSSNAHNLSHLNPASSTALSLDPRLARLQQPLQQNIASLQTSAMHTLDPNTAFLLGVCTVLQGLQSSNPGPNNKADGTHDVCDLVGKGRKSVLSLGSSPGYVRLFGLPATATKEDICSFFSGLEVQEVIMNVKLGLSFGCLVKFANAEDACKALDLNQQFLGLIRVEVRGATEKMWTTVLQESENGVDDIKRHELHPSPLKETANSKQTSPSLPLGKRPSDPLSPNKQEKKPRPHRDSSAVLSQKMDYIVMACNLPKKMTKTDIKELFQCPNLAHKNVLHLLDKEGNRTDTAFLIFNCIEDYNYAINLNGCHIGSAMVEVLSITRKKMKDMMVKHKPGGTRQT